MDSTAAKSFAAGGPLEARSLHLETAPKRNTFAPTSIAEVSIRTLGFSLLAVAAIASGLLLARQRPDSDPTDQIPAGERAPNRRSLDAIRAAGL